MINLFGLTLHLYGLLIGVGVWAGLEVALRAKPEMRKEMEGAFWWMIIPGVVGARLYHVIDFWNRYYVANLWKIPAIWEGGLGIWGAILGGLVGLYIYCEYKKVKLLPLLNAYAVGVPLAQAIGRLGNRVNGELVGKNGEPLFAFEAILNLMLFVLLRRASKNKTYSNKLFGLYLIGYGLIRILLENLRPDEIIWRLYGVPTAIIFGLIAIVSGLWMVAHTND